VYAVHASARDSDDGVREDVFIALDLVQNAPQGASGKARCHAAFAEL
jgi:hypothetical protein